MKTAIDSAGRVLIPKSVRVDAGLFAGMPLEVRHVDGRVVIEPAPLEVRIGRKGRFAVATPTRAVPPLEARTVEATRRRVRGERDGEK